MIDHVSIGVRDLASAKAFYQTVLAEIGYAVIDDRPNTVGFGKKYSDFWLNVRPNRPQGGDTGVHICLRTRTKGQVDAFYETALQAGGEDSGPPGLRPQHGTNYYAAFIKDADGNMVEVVTFLEEEK